MHKLRVFVCAALVAVACALGLISPAYADEEGVDTAPVGNVINVVATYDGEPLALFPVSFYRIATASDGASAGDIITPDVGEDYIFTLGDVDSVSASALKMADDIASGVLTLDGKAFTSDDFGKVVASGLDDGIYLVVPGDVSTCRGVPLMVLVPDETSASVKFMAPGTGGDYRSNAYMTSLTKSADKAEAYHGDEVVFSGHVGAPSELALDKELVVVDNLPVGFTMSGEPDVHAPEGSSVEVAKDGKSFTVTVPTIDEATVVNYTYTTTVDTSAIDGEHPSTVTATVRDAEPQTASTSVGVLTSTEKLPDTGVYYMGGVAALLCVAAILGFVYARRKASVDED